MFGGKDKQEERKPMSTVDTTPVSSPTKGKSQPASQITAYLGPDIEGVLKFENSVLIEGTFKGKIESGGSLVIGDDARVDAEITTRSITIKGKVKGSITASERVEIKNRGELLGDIVTSSLQMDETVTFEGSCSMAPKGSTPRRDQAPRKEAVDEIVQAVETTRS
jgi:cytoskeletal protein CcmA (bactofilin family)